MKKKKRMVILALAIIMVVTAAYLMFKAPGDPADRFARLLNRRDIEKPNIIFITLDTTRADHLPCYGYKKTHTPVMDELARKGAVFEQCISPTPLTLPAHASMMTGQYPTFHGIRVNGNNALSQQHETLAEKLAEQGYSCGAFIARLFWTAAGA